MFTKEPSCFSGKLGKTLLYSYLLLSFIFIAWTYYDDFKMNYGQQNFDRGSQFAFAQVIEKAQSGCDAFSVNLGENSVNLINVSCLQNTQNQTQ